jgi:hypothetical protein
MVPSPGRNAGKQEVEADLQLSYITDKNNSLLDEISELLHELDSISILVDEKRSIFGQNQHASIRIFDESAKAGHNGKRHVCLLTSTF